jgi:hypothetical protein
MKQRISDKIPSNQSQTSDLVEEPSIVAQDALQRSLTAALEEGKIFSTAPMTSASAAPGAKTNSQGVLKTGFLSENLLLALEGMLQQAAENAVASAISSRLTPAVNQAGKAIIDFSQSCVRRVEQHCTEIREKFSASVQQDFLDRMQADIVRAQEQLQQQLRKQVERSLATAREGMQEIAEAAHTRFDATSAASLVQLLAASKAETERITGDARRNAESSLAAVAAKWEARQRDFQEQIVHSMQVEIDEFRQRLESILSSSMSTAIGAANDHSRILLESLLKGTAEQLKNSGSKTTPR